MIRKHQRFLNLVQVSFDAISLLFAYVVSILITMNPDEIAAIGVKDFILSLWMIPIIIVTYYFLDMYSSMRNRVFRKEVLIILRAHLVGIVSIFSVLFLFNIQEVSRKGSLLFAFFGLVFLLVERSLVRRTLHSIRKKGYNQKNMLIIGAGPLGIEFARKARAHREFGYTVVGFLDDNEEKHENSIIGKPVIGGIEMLAEILADQAVDEVVVALPLNAYGKYVEIVEVCEKAGIRIRIIPDYCKLLPFNLKVEEFDGIHLLNVRAIPLDDPFNRFIKRSFDVCFSAITIFATGPLLLFIALCIKVTSSGPILFRQERIGLNNRPFNMFKFRSMRVDDNNTSETRWTTANDPRKTRFGSFLRKTSLDELPQFFNVLFGTMSIVGPRPERPFFVQQFKEEIPKYMVKHQIKPGITGWAQVNGWRGDTSIAKRIECDIYYIENWDFLFDLKIMIMTIVKGLVNKNAY